MSKQIIGITGGIGCGKTTVTNIFVELGIKVIDADVVARGVVAINSAGLSAITDRFGPSILLNNGELDRAKLRQIIFDDIEQKNWLENLLHPLIRQRITNQLLADRSDNAYTLLSSPLLLETDQHKMTDFIIVIDLENERQIKRAMNRDANSRDQINKIIASQLSREQRSAKADIIINNDGSIKDLKQQVLNTHLELSQKFSASTYP